MTWKTSPKVSVIALIADLIAKLLALAPNTVFRPQIMTEALIELDMKNKINCTRELIDDISSLNRAYVCFEDGVS